jgi:lysozyme family protein
MQRNFEKALALVLKHEGGFVDHPADPGGATNKGITIATFRRYVDPKGTVDDLKKITAQQVATVYRKQYWNAVKGDQLPDGVDYAVFDFAVNSGPSRAAKFLQRIVAVPEDGKIGPQTIKATTTLSASAASAVIRMLCRDRMEFLRGLKTWPTFGKGWTRRVNEVQLEALKMAQEPPKPPIPAPDDEPDPIAVEVSPNSPKTPKAEKAEKARGLWAFIKFLFNEILGRN